MGYDSRIYIVDKSCADIRMDVVVDDVNYGNRKWAEVIATIELGKYPTIADFMRNQPETDSYIYGVDSHEMIVEDCYGKVMTECSVDELLEVVQKEIDSGEDYRRLAPLYGLLKGFKPVQWHDLRVLHYGH